MGCKLFDSLEFTRGLLAEKRPAHAFVGGDPEAISHWQIGVRRRLARLLGGFPRIDTPLEAATSAKIRFDGYTRHKVIFSSRPELNIFGYLLVPNGVELPAPAVICLPGHGRGVDDIVGIRLDGSQRSRIGGYQRDFALQCVRSGFVTLAIEQLGFGRRRDQTARKAGARASSCQPAAGAALLLGQTMIGWRAYDVRRAVDYLRSIPQVLPQRIGLVGISGGGATALFAAALDTRLRAAVVSGYFCTFRESIAEIPHCMDNYVPGISNLVEMYDLAGLVAPRALFVESGSRDPIFPVKAVRKAIGEAARIYRAFGVPERFAAEIFDGDHRFHGKGAFKFLKQNL